MSPKASSDPKIPAARRLSQYVQRRDQLHDQYVQAQLDLVAPLNPTHPTIGTPGDAAPAEEDHEAKKRLDLLATGIAEVEKLIDEAEKERAKEQEEVDRRERAHAGGEG